MLRVDNADGSCEYINPVPGLVGIPQQKKEHDRCTVGRLALVVRSKESRYDMAYIDTTPTGFVIALLSEIEPKDKVKHLINK